MKIGMTMALKRYILNKMKNNIKSEKKLFITGSNIEEISKILTLDQSNRSDLQEDKFNNKLNILFKVNLN